jgi:hypothetical protein
MQWGCWGRSNEAQPLKCRIAHAQQCAYAKIPIYIAQSCPTELTKFHFLTLNGLLLNYNISLLIFKCLGSINHEVRKLRFSEMLKCGDQNISMRNLTFGLSRDYCSYTNYHSRSLDIYTHNNIQIHNNVMWDWQYPHNILWNIAIPVMDINNVMLVLTTQVWNNSKLSRQHAWNEKRIKFAL